MAAFQYQELFEHHADTTPYRRLTSDYVSTAAFGGQEILQVAPEALTLIAREAMDDVAHLLRSSHLRQLAAILDDPEASGNDRFVALELLKNASIAASRVLPGCQDTGTAIAIGYKGGKRLHLRQRRRGAVTRHLPGVRRAQPALLADGAARHVPREEHRHQPAGAD